MTKLIRIYTHWEDLKKAPYSIYSNDAAFKGFSKRPEIYTQYVREVMLKVDKTILLDANTGLIKTPYEITTVDSLSTGCKTVINAICCIKFNNTPVIINANDCNPTALSELFKVADNQNIKLLLMHPLLPRDLCWSFIVNDSEDVVDCFNLRYRILGIG